ncbi:MAG: hypothetical protein KF684_13155 [Phycisphaeraceae bacterium]|nr:hypothetical protein [Phycisphaeraceae bacterium]
MRRTLSIALATALAASLGGAGWAQSFVRPFGSWLPPGGVPTQDLRFSFVPDGVEVPETIAYFPQFPTTVVVPGPNELVGRMNTVFADSGGLSEFSQRFQAIAGAWTDETALDLRLVANQSGVDDGEALGSPGSTRRGDIRVVARPFVSGQQSRPFFVVAANEGADAYSGEIILNTLVYPWNLQPGQPFDPAARDYWTRVYLQNAIGQAIGVNPHCTTVFDTMMRGLDLSAINDPVIDTPAHTDILALQFMYGDAFEGNDTPATATQLVTLQSGVVSAPCVARTAGGEARSRCSVRNESDLDYFQVTVAAPGTLSATVTAVGLRFNYGSTCDTSSGSRRDARTRNAATLSVRILGPAPATTEIASGVPVPGADGTLAIAAATVGPGSYYVVVSASDFEPGVTNLVPTPQMYSLSVLATDAASAGDCPGDTNGDGAINFADLNTVLSNFGTACP